MEKITKKSFIDGLTAADSIFIGVLKNKSDEIIAEKINGLFPDIFRGAKTRKAAAHAKSLEFVCNSGENSYLSMSENGIQYAYFTHTTAAGKFFIQKSTAILDFGCEVETLIKHTIYRIA